VVILILATAYSLQPTARVARRSRASPMRRNRTRDFDVFSMSFLDTICCAFGAVILLFVLSKFGEPKALEQARVDLEGKIAKLQQELYQLKGETEIVNRDLLARRIVMNDEKSRVAHLAGDLTDLRGKYKASKQDADVANDIQGRLVTAQEKLTAEMKRVLSQGFHRKKDDAVGGIPVDSEYIIFCIDTSGSMFNFSWQLMLKKMQETLDAYPTVKGFQVMNDQGIYMFPSYRGKWIPDTPAQRKTVLDRLRTWNAFSASSPVEGIMEAVRTYADQGKKISVYVFGDEFTGPSIDSAVKAIDFLNHKDATGERHVRIHALGFPLEPDAPQYTSIRFATLMTIVCSRNGGTFVGLINPAENGRGRIGAKSDRSPPVVAGDDSASAPAFAATLEEQDAK
jgi:hypothetical protein